MASRIRHEPLLTAAWLALLALFVANFFVQDVFLPNFFLIPVAVSSALGRPPATALLAGAAVLLSAGALVYEGDFSVRASGRVALQVGAALASIWVADIVARGRRALAEREAQMRMLAENASDIVFRSSPVAVIEWVSPSVERELGYRVDQMVGRPIGTFVHPNDVEGMLQASRELNAHRTPVAYRARFQRIDGSLTWMEVNARPVIENGELAGLIGSARRMDSQVKLEDELRRRATTDDLTGATRRDEAIQHLQALRHARERTGHGSAVIFCDIDLFKSINDTYGHAGGDEVLRVVAHRLREHLREEDSVARFGGDEFVVILNSIHSMADAERIAAKLHRTTLRGISMPDGRTAHVSLSMGVAEVRDGESITEVLARADEALYEAKRAGRDRVVCAP